MHSGRNRHGLLGYEQCLLIGLADCWHEGACLRMKAVQREDWALKGAAWWRPRFRRRSSSPLLRRVALVIVCLFVRLCTFAHNESPYYSVLLLREDGDGRSFNFRGNKDIAKNNCGVNWIIEIQAEEDLKMLHGR